MFPLHSPPRPRQKLNNRLSKSKKMAAKTTAEVVWRPSAEDGNAAMVAVVAKATAEVGGVTGRQGGRGDCSDSCRGVQRSSSDDFDNHRSTGKTWSNTSPNNDGGGGGRGSGRGGGGGEKNHHTLSSYRRRTVILPDCTNSCGGVLDAVHCPCIGSGGGGGARILPMIGKTMMRAARGVAPATTAATAMTWPGTAPAT